MRKRAWPKNQGWHGQNQMPFFLVFIETLTYNVQQELACFKTFPSTRPFCHRLTGLHMENEGKVVITQKSTKAFDVLDL